MDIAPHELHWRDAYKLMIGSILPRPIAFVSTIDPNGTANLAPFSFFTAICAEPFLIGFAPMRRGTDGRKKIRLSILKRSANSSSISSVNRSSSR